MIINTQDFTLALVGGLIIGLSVTIMLLFQGRVTGISGILFGAIEPHRADRSWRLYFLVGLFLGGFVLSWLMPESLYNSLEFNPLRLIVAGLLVGYGTVLGNGCTSGHGVCGISRFSLRSITATLTFIAFGIGIVALMGVN